MKRALVTGASGFIGANLVRRLIADGHAVHLLLRQDGDPWRVDPVRRDVVIHAGDLADDASVRAAVEAAKPDWIFHLAAHGGYSWQRDTAKILETNFSGTVRLLEACARRGFEAFVNTGSSSEYGYQDHPPVESEAVAPNSAYAVAKVGATLYAALVAREHKLKIATLRVYSAYGPWEEPNRLVPTLVARGLSGEWPPLVDPTVARDFVHVDDVVDAYLRAATGSVDEPGAVFNVATGTMTTIRDAVAIARRVFGIKAEPVWGSMPNRGWDTTVWVGDSTRIRKALGWAPTIGFEAGLSRTGDWFRADPARLAFYRSRQPAA